MSCQKFRGEIEESARGASLGAEAAAHVAVCAGCRAFREERENLRGLVASLARVEAPSDFEFRLRARIARDGGARPSGTPWRGLVPNAAWVAVAACLVLAVGLFLHTPTRDAVEPIAGASDATTNGATTGKIAANNPAQVTPQSFEQSNKQSDGGGAQDESSTPTRLVRASGDATRKHRYVLPREALEQMAEAQSAQRAPGENVLSEEGLKIYTASPIPLPVNASSQPLEVQFTDSRGASRVVSVDPVTFGARALPAPHGRAATVKYTQPQGVW